MWQATTEFGSLSLALVSKAEGADHRSDRARGIGSRGVGSGGRARAEWRGLRNCEADVFKLFARVYQRRQREHGIDTVGYYACNASITLRVAQRMAARAIRGQRRASARGRSLKQASVGEGVGRQLAELGKGSKRVHSAMETTDEYKDSRPTDEFCIKRRWGLARRRERRNTTNQLEPFKVDQSGFQRNNRHPRRQ
ncbi:hypothetical protein F5Y17DRAFT_320264 [Xylariaceae sp. FL0594]|nr:hypothetical protein F5Y17DRAFT_320264 [Xylariaceae sp. FL0594]